jgi:DNA-binding transcriptional MerR regulator
MTRKSRPAAPKRNKPKAAAPARTVTQQLVAGMPERGLKIGEAAEVLGVETYVLRFWETQFPFLRPRHTRTKHRFYHDHDLEVLRLIKRLLHQEGFTIAGANKYIRENGLETLLAGKPTTVVRPELTSSAGETPPKSAVDGQTRRVLSDLRRDLESLHKMLE